MKIQQTRIIGTNVVVYSAWEPMAGHSTMTTIDGAWWGRIGCRPLPAELDALPARSDERFLAVTEWHEAQYQEAYSAILAQAPEARGGYLKMGEITITV
jgi:hypothetical protein